MNQSQQMNDLMEKMGWMHSTAQSLLNASRPGSVEYRIALAALTASGNFQQLVDIEASFLKEEEP